jgi:septum site-determining protein MinC
MFDTTNAPVLQIKGIKEGLMVTMGEGEWRDLREALLKQVAEKNNFFKGARLALDVGNQVLHAAELGSLRDHLSDQGISLWAVISNSPLTEKTAQVLGLATKLSTPRPDRAIRPQDTSVLGDDAIFVQRTLRSGFKIEAHSHVVVLGDVNPGAEVVADGSIIVWGRLRGAAHAGASGDVNAMICALDLSPMQLRIADQTEVDRAKTQKNIPLIARVCDGLIKVEPWNP